jgi:hypothetical protein
LVEAIRALSAFEIFFSAGSTGDKNYKPIGFSISLDPKAPFKKQDKTP